jgi:hypothetical protein
MPLTSPSLRPLLTFLFAAVLAGPAALPAAGGCGCESGPYATAEGIARAIGWKLEWVVQLPFDTGRWSLEAVKVEDNAVIGQSTDGGVHFIRGGEGPDRGTVAWSGRAGRPSDPGYPPTLGPSLVLASRGFDVVAFERDSGDIRWHDRLAQPTSGPAVEIEDWVFVPTSSQRLLRLAANPHATPRRGPPPAADERRRRDEAGTRRTGPVLESKTPLLIDMGAAETDGSLQRVGPGLLCSIDSRGTLVSLFDGNSGWVRDELRTGGPPADGFLRRGTTLWLATSLGDIASVEAVAGRGFTIGWRQALRAKPDGQLLVDRNVLVVSLGAWGVEGRVAQSGSPLWRIDQPVSLLAAGGGLVWWIDATGRLSAVDIASGEPKARLPLGPFRFAVHNTRSTSLALATPEGVIALLSPPAGEAAGPPGGGEDGPQPARERADADEADEAAPADEMQDGADDRDDEPADEPSEFDDLFGDFGS